MDTRLQGKKFQPTPVSSDKRCGAETAFIFESVEEQKVAYISSRNEGEEEADGTGANAGIVAATTAVSAVYQKV